MKKVAAVLLILTMIMSLAACGKSEDNGKNGSSDQIKVVEQTTKTPEPTKEAETTKTPETTKEPEVTKEAETTPEATPEATPTPTPVITEEPTQEEDEFYSEGHGFNGTWKADGCTLVIMAEGAADVIYACFENTDRESFGSWHEIWTNYDEDRRAFVGSNDQYFYFANGELQCDNIESVNTFNAKGDNMYWVEEDLGFKRTSYECEELVFVEKETENDYWYEDEFYNPGHRYCGVYKGDRGCLDIDGEDYAIIIRVCLDPDADPYGNWNEYYEYWVDYSEEEKTFRCQSEYAARHKFIVDDELISEYVDTTYFVIDDSGETPLIGWPIEQADFFQIRNDGYDY
ncbi:MAG: hypothetical protein IKP88_08540 [Lachnospiraceae bacterium]|nr:hypothetical protein [Lachnospiraceae bacterium]